MYTANKIKQYLHPINFFKGFLLVTCAGKKEEKVEDSGMNIFGLQV